MFLDVLNRISYRANSKPAGCTTPQEPDMCVADHDRDNNGVIHVMMYIFPRQFGLHNVFTSLVDHLQTAQKLQDYTLREEEIAKKFAKKDKSGHPIPGHLPKRLRGTVRHLVQRLQILHGRCAYAEMLQYYCPVRCTILLAS